MIRFCVFRERLVCEQCCIDLGGCNGPCPHVSQLDSLRPREKGLERFARDRSFHWIHFRPPVSSLLRDSVSSEDENPLDLGPKVRKKPRHPPKPASTELGVDLSHRSVLLFPGQGSQFVGMGKKLLEVPTVRELYAEASQILGYDLLALSLDGPQNLLDRTRYCQPATVVASLAAVELLYQVMPHSARGRW